MTGTELIVAALAAGAGAGITEGTTGVVGEAYRDLWQRLRSRFAAQGNGVVTVLNPPAEADEAALAEWQNLMASAIRESRAFEDDEICQRALQVCEALTPSGRGSTVITQSKGVYSGDYGIQNNHF
ncbi:hypothetical protein OG288_44170 [Streptomyces tauricus]|uniref:Uncharacterized protein n=1 Tax=Streptomyces tauricus TaxID=68274 RepID=A0ABZ1JYA9_9ACTN|nr:hypothetical protein [Streptomyces tauricus]